MNLDINQCGAAAQQVNNLLVKLDLTQQQVAYVLALLLASVCLETNEPYVAANAVHEDVLRVITDLAWTQHTSHNC
jgi:hypothetical protein